MDTASPFHDGERAVQARAGVGDMGPLAAGFVRDRFPEQHRAFHTALPFLVAAARDGTGRIWATMLEGPDGFVKIPDPRRMHLAARPGPGDPLEGRLDGGAPVGLLGIDLSTRRRNRVNGRATATAEGLEVAVDQTFGNCPQYISPRPVTRAKAAPRPAVHGDRLDAMQIARLRAADTFFIATGHPAPDGARSHGMDASHRGGPPGFVRVAEDGRRLRIPDYSGNDFFNTLGNLTRDPRAGLLFVDFETGGLLHLTGRIEIDWTDDPATGARRHLDVAIEAVIDRPGVLALRWGAPDAALRRLRVVDRVDEADDVVSFWLGAEDGTALPDAAPGQHLPIRLAPRGGPVLERSYSLSGPPGAGLWRITVKRDAGGVASRLMHDHLEVGGGIEGLAPSGSFDAPGGGPIVLVGAGIGVTPMAAHLHAAAASGRRALLVRSARRGAEDALRAELHALGEAHPNVDLRVAYSAPDARDAGHDWTGRLSAERVLEAASELTDPDYLLCGPPAFVTALEGGLIRHGIAPSRIRKETF